MISFTRGNHVASSEPHGLQARPSGNQMPSPMSRPSRRTARRRCVSPRRSQQLAQHLVGGGAVVADGLGHAGGKSVGEFELVERPDRGLGGHVVVQPGAGHAVVDRRPSPSRNSRSRGISTSSKITKASCSSKRLDSGRSKGSRRRCGGAVAAQEDQPRRCPPGWRRPGRSPRRPRGCGRARVDGDLVGEGGQGGQNAGSAHHDAVGGLADLVQGDRVADDLGVGATCRWLAG